jgi:hypothetical protein
MVESPDGQKGVSFWFHTLLFERKRAQIKSGKRKSKSEIGKAESTNPEVRGQQTADGQRMTEPRSTGSFRSVNPVFRPPGTMSHSQNPNCIIPNEKGNVISENFQVNPPVSLWAKAWNFRMVANPVNYHANFLFQPDAQARFDSFIVGNGFA